MEEAHGTTTPEVANIITILDSVFKGSEVIKFLYHFQDIFFSGLIILFIATIARLATKKKSLAPGKLQNFVEMCVEVLDDFVTGTLGHYGRTYLPFIGTLFIYIFVMNMSGLVPGLKSPSSNLNTTVALATTVFIYVQYTGLRRLGIIGYIDHLAGRPRDIIGFLFIPLMLPLHILGELIKPVSLSLRLFGNILGEDALIAAFVVLGIMALSFFSSPVGLPLQLPFMMLAVITGTIQALVFTLLSTIYIAMMLPHEEH